MSQSIQHPVVTVCLFLFGTTVLTYCLGMVTPNGQEGDSSGANVCGRIMEVALISSVVYYPLTLTRDTNGSDIVNLRRLIFLYLINVNITTRRRLDVKHGRLRVSANFPKQI